MARFFFHVRTPSRVQQDDVGIEFRDLEQARRYAALSAEELLGEMSGVGFDAALWFVEITDAGGVLLASLPFGGGYVPNGSSSRGGEERSFDLR